MEFLALGVTLIVGVGLGICIGIFIGVDRMRKAVEDQSVGYLRIDRSDPYEPPASFLELETGIDIELVSKKQFIMLKVVNENYISCD